eukprot:4900609-Amphidinium_carterae.1
MMHRSKHMQAPQPHLLRINLSILSPAESPAWAVLAEASAAPVEPGRYHSQRQPYASSLPTTLAANYTQVAFESSVAIPGDFFRTPCTW